jgi:hypothetical protein
MMKKAKAMWANLVSKMLSTSQDVLYSCSLGFMTKMRIHSIDEWDDDEMMDVQEVRAGLFAKKQAMFVVIDAFVFSVQGTRKFVPLFPN